MITKEHNGQLHTYTFEKAYVEASDEGVLTWLAVFRVSLEGVPQWLHEVRGEGDMPTLPEIEASI